MKNIVVSKFGGTSMADAQCMIRSANVSVLQKSNLIVVSATTGTTTLLIELAQTAEKKNMARNRIDSKKNFRQSFENCQRSKSA